MFIGGGYDERLERLAKVDAETKLCERVGSAAAMAFDAEVQRTGARKRLEGLVTYE